MPANSRWDLIQRLKGESVNAKIKVILHGVGVLPEKILVVHLPFKKIDLWKWGKYLCFNWKFPIIFLPQDH